MSKIVRSYEACPREPVEARTRWKVTPWSDELLSALLVMYGTEETVRPHDKPLMKRIEVAVAYLFRRKERGQPRKCPACRNIRPTNSE